MKCPHCGDEMNAEQVGGPLGTPPCLRCALEGKSPVEMTDDAPANVIDLTDHRWIEKGSPEWQDSIMEVLNEHTDRLRRLEDANPIRCSTCRKIPERGVNGLYDLNGWVEVLSPFRAWRCPKHIPAEILASRREGTAT